MNGLALLGRAVEFLGLTATHALLMFPYITLPPFLLSPLLQTFGRARARDRLLRCPQSGWRAAWLGICSRPGRSSIFGEARVLFAAGVDPAGVLAYVVSAHSLTVYFVFLIAALNGPQPVIGLALSALLCAALLRVLLRRIPQEEWRRARAAVAAGQAVSESADAGPGASQPAGVLRRLPRAVAGDLRSLWWPILFGATLGAAVAAWGLSPAFFSLQGDRGVLAQLVGAVAGLLLAGLSGVPPVGNVFTAAWLWKAEFFTYAGLMAFYLGSLVTPFALPRYTRLFGRSLARRAVGRLILAALLSALVVTGLWHGLDALLHAAGLEEPIERLLGSTIEPSAVPWFHRLFWGDGHAM